MTSSCLSGSVRSIRHRHHSFFRSRGPFRTCCLALPMLLLTALLFSCDGGSSGGTWPRPSRQIALTWSAPAPDTTVSGTVQLSLVGRQLVNVEIFNDGQMITRCQVAADGKSATARIDTTRFEDGPLTLTAHAWNSPAGTSFTQETDAGALTFTVANGNTDGGDGNTDSPFVPAGYRKVFGDEFNGTKDAGFYDRWNTLAPWGVQWYSDSDQKQAFIDEGVILRDGRCTFEAKKSDVLLSNYQWISSGSITTNRTFVHGYFEARVWMPDADQKGAWPAFWLTSSTRWPPEWDIFEVVSSNWRTLYHYDHMPSGQSSWNISGSSEYRGVDVRDGFHIYALLWTSSEVSWYVDGVLTRKIGISGAGDDTMWLNVSQQVGGTWPGYPDASTQWPMLMHVDYVRVYQK